MVSPAVKCCSCLPWCNVLDFRVKALAKQLYRAIFIKCQDMVSCWKAVAVKKPKIDLVVSKASR